MSLRVAVSGDHNGVALIARIVDRLTARGHEVIDLTPSTSGVVDYPALCAQVGRAVARSDVDLGVIVGGSGQGEVIACNKIRGVRAGLAYSEFAVDISRGNNDANVIVLGSKVTDEQSSLDLLDRWLRTPFNGGVHAQRIAQIAQIEGAEGRTGN